MTAEPRIHKVLERANRGAMKDGMMGMAITDALKELIDNPLGRPNTDGFPEAEISIYLTIAPKAPIPVVQVRSCGGRGMGPKELDEYFQWGSEDDDREGLSQYRIGGKTACGAIGNRVEIWCRKAGEDTACYVDYPNYALGRGFIEVDVKPHTPIITHGIDVATRRAEWTGKEQQVASIGPVPLIRTPIEDGEVLIRVTELHEEKFNAWVGNTHGRGRYALSNDLRSTYRAFLQGERSPSASIYHCNPSTTKKADAGKKWQVNAISGTDIPFASEPTSVSVAMSYEGRNYQASGAVGIYDKAKVEESQLARKKHLDGVPEWQRGEPLDYSYLKNGIRLLFEGRVVRQDFLGSTRKKLRRKGISTNAYEYITGEIHLDGFRVTQDKREFHEQGKGISHHIWEMLEEKVCEQIGSVISEAEALVPPGMVSKALQEKWDRQQVDMHKLLDALAEQEFEEELAEERIAKARKAEAADVGRAISEAEGYGVLERAPRWGPKGLDPLEDIWDTSPDGRARAIPSSNPREEAPGAATGRKNQARTSAPPDSVGKLHRVKGANGRARPLAPDRPFDCEVGVLPVDIRAAVRYRDENPTPMITVNSEHPAYSVTTTGALETAWRYYRAMTDLDTREYEEEINEKLSKLFGRIEELLS